MPSLNTFLIEFDRPNAVYAPGEIVSGHVIIGLVKEKIAEALKLSANGEAKVSWDNEKSTTDGDGNSTTTRDSYTGNEKYFNLSISLLEKSNDGKVYLPAGLSRYPFSIQLPHDIPCSFEHNVGHIRYTMKVAIVRSWRFDHKCNVTFTINTTYDLNIRPEQCIGICDRVNEAFSYLCCVGNDSINICVKLPTTGFVPGQWIETFLDLSNSTSNELHKICIKLRQYFEFHATMSTKRIKETVAVTKETGPFNKDAVITLRLLIPSTPPSELEFCKIINLKYSLRITFHTNTKMYRKIVRKYPILIGTIPLQHVPSAPAASSSSRSTSRNVDTTVESNVISSAPHPSSSSIERSSAV